MEEFDATEIRELNQKADDEANDVKRAIRAEWEAHRVGRAVIDRWTQGALSRLHQGLLRQRELAGINNDWAGPTPTTREGTRE